VNDTFQCDNLPQPAFNRQCLIYHVTLLHDHVDCEDECWYLRVDQVVDEQQLLLGWGLFVVHFPGLPSSASLEDRQHAPQARVLLVEHHASQRDALMAKDCILLFMETERVENPGLAYEDDTDILELISTGADLAVDRWAEYANVALQNFLNSMVFFTCARKNWQPPQQSPVDAFFVQHLQPVWLEDQLRSVPDAKISLDPEANTTSPWQQLDWD